MTKNKILEFLFWNTEIDSQIVNIYIPYLTSEGYEGLVIAYINHYEGIFYVWLDRNHTSIDYGVSLFYVENETQIYTSIYSNSCEKDAIIFPKEDASAYVSLLKTYVNKYLEND
jgi:hypothetical protein